MHLYVLRHAIAEERSSRWTGHDADRPLTRKGAKKMKRIASTMLDLGISFDIILSSPFRRAQQTAEIVAGRFDCPERLHYTRHLKVGASRRALVRELSSRFGTRESVLLVGHEPFLSGLISTLIAGDDRVPITLKKGGICKLTVNTLRFGRCATLDWLVGPSQILLSADRS